MKFSEIPYQRPVLSRVSGRLDEIAARIAEAASLEEVLSQYRAFEKLFGTVSTMATVAEIRHTVDTRDAFYEAEQEFYDENMPAIDEKKLNVYRAVLASPYREALSEALSPIALEKMEIDVKAQSPEVLSLMAEENALQSAYQKLYASAQIPFRGEVLTIAQIGKYKNDPDRTLRKEAFEAEGSWFDAHRGEFDEIFDKLVKNRTEQARKMGYENYIELGAIRMRRIGYSIEEMAAFREQVRKDVVPVVAELKKLQHERTGVRDPKYYDDTFCFPDGNPAPKGTPEEILAAGKKMYNELSPETAEMINEMFDRELFDVLAKPGKAPGGYCTTISDYGLPFIFSNFNGTSGDVDVLTHEAGHAFAAWTAERSSLPQILREPGMESCEIHSMSMEFLTGAFHHLFFKEDTEKYALAHAEDCMYFLPYGTIIDEFQHRVYEAPDMSPEERNRLWAELEREFRPWIDFAGLPFYGRGAGWQRQLHVYLYPFYYIDYCLAQSAALQFFTAWLKDRDDAWRRYLRLVEKAGTEPYPGLVKAAGFLNPFDAGSMKQIAEAVAAWIREADASYRMAAKEPEK